jgi:hypothetical protein
MLLTLPTPLSPNKKRQEMSNFWHLYNRDKPSSNHTFKKYYRRIVAILQISRHDTDKKCFIPAAASPIIVDLFHSIVLISISLTVGR